MAQCWAACVWKAEGIGHARFPEAGGRIDSHSLVPMLGWNLLCVQPPSCPPSPSWQAVVQGRQTLSLSQDRCVLAALFAPSLGSPPPSPLPHPSRALSVECPVPGSLASLLSSLMLLVAAFALTKKGLRFGFHNCCGGICYLSYVWCVSGLEMPPSTIVCSPS